MRKTNENHENKGNKEDNQNFREFRDFRSKPLNLIKLKKGSFASRYFYEQRLINDESVLKIKPFNKKKIIII